MKKISELNQQFDISVYKQKSNKQKLFSTDQMKNKMKYLNYKMEIYLLVDIQTFHKFILFVI